jgi:hypothetical protein
MYERHMVWAWIKLERTKTRHTEIELDKERVTNDLHYVDKTNVKGIS